MWFQNYKKLNVISKNLLLIVQQPDFSFYIKIVISILKIYEG